MKFLIASAAVLLLSCASHSSVAAPKSAGMPVMRTQVLRGWLPDYDAFIKSEVQKYPELLTIPPNRLSNFCPGFVKILDKAQFYADLLWSISGPESDRRRTQITLETELDGVANPIDPVTGYQVRSEGLLQLSYQDVVNYGAPRACSFDWAADKAKAIKDYTKGRKYGDGTRSIHDAYNNLRCGIFIVNAHLTSLYPSANFEDALRRYWITMDPADPGYKRVRSNIIKRQPACK